MTHETPKPKYPKPNAKPKPKDFLTEEFNKAENKKAILSRVKPGRWNGAKPRGPDNPAINIKKYGEYLTLLIELKIMELVSWACFIG